MRILSGFSLSVLMGVLPIVAFTSSSMAAGLAVSAISPASGPIAGATTVTLTGSGFTSGTTVVVGGLACATPQVISDTQLTCVTADHVAGVADVLVTDAAGGAATLAAAYTYQGIATLTLLERRVFNRTIDGAVVSCEKCHSGAHPAGRLDTTIYSNLLNEVKPGDPNSSRIYSLVSMGKMPRNQPLLLPEEKQAIADWITDGAKNN